MAKILLIEDDTSLRQIIAEVLRSSTHEVWAFDCAEKGIVAMREAEFDLVLTDLKLGKKTGIDFVREVREFNSLTPILLMTAYGTVDLAVSAIKLGAQDFFMKPFDLEFLEKTVSKYLDVGISVRRKSLSGEIVTKNPKMLELIRLVSKAIKLDTPILITGESGVGKEVLARYIHNHSRSNNPFVGVNCGSIPKNLIESEFFGYEAGAFTGATVAKEGFFEAANNGTLFLDEIGEMTPAAQVKLLRAVQEGENRRVGSTKAKPVNVRLISATNRDLEVEVSKGNFREDLFYRICVFSVRIPPLRDRKDDIPLLVDHFLTDFSNSVNFSSDDTSRAHLPKVQVTNEAMRDLYSYDWPGNIRELQNTIERAVILSDGVIDRQHLALNKQESNVEKAASTGLLELSQIAQKNTEVRAILEALTNSKGNKTKAAKDLGVSYKTLLTKIKEYELF